VANIQTSEKRYFDSRDTKLTVRHVMASGALPPAFPAVRIDGELYWDGGILSNTPVDAVFDDPAATRSCSRSTGESRRTRAGDAQIQIPAVAKALPGSAGHRGGHARIRRGGVAHLAQAAFAHS
jgi:predicted acylesterase/phospholipase RssA